MQALSKAVWDPNHMSDVDDPGWHTYVTVRVGCGCTAECSALGPVALPVASSIIFILRNENHSSGRTRRTA